MEEKIERILEEYIFLWNEPDDPIDWKIAGYEPAAAEIAKQIEAIELGWADKVEELTDAWHSRLAKQETQLRVCENGLRYCGERYDVLLAQLAEMGEALVEMLALYDSEKGFKATQPEIDAWIEYCELTKIKAQKALSAAPEVKNGKED